MRQPSSNKPDLLMLLLSLGIHIAIFIIAMWSVTEDSYLPDFEAAARKSVQNRSIQLRLTNTRASQSYTGQSFQKQKVAANKAGRFTSDVIQKTNRKIQNSIIYPRLARKMGWQGRASLRIQVSKMGEIGQINIVSSSGHSVLDQAAIKGVHNYPFKAGQQSETILLHFQFTLKQSRL